MDISDHRSWHGYTGESQEAYRMPSFLPESGFSGAESPLMPGTSAVKGRSAGDSFWVVERNKIAAAKRVD